MNDNNINPISKKVIRALSSEINELKSSNKKLNNDLLAERNNNEILTNKNNILEDELNKYKINDNKIIDLKQPMWKIDDKIKDSKMIGKSNLDYIIPGEKILNIHFRSTDKNIELSILCKKTDIFVRLEEQLYEKYPEFKEYNNFFTCNGLVIKRWKSLEENNIKSSDKIDINNYAKINLI